VDKISVAIISSFVGKTPEAIAYSFVFDEAYRLSKRGINVHIIRSRFEGDSTSCGMHYHGLRRMVDMRAIELFLHNFRVYPPISLLRNPAKIYWENLYASNAIDIINREKIDLIHAHFAYPEGLIGLLAKGSVRRSLIVTCHGYDINVVPEVNYGIRLDKRIDLIVRKVLKYADAIICVSSEMRKRIMKLGITKDKIHVVFNGVDTSQFRPLMKDDHEEIELVRKWLGVHNNDFMILNARHLRPVYGLKYLIKAAKIVHKYVKNIKFIIAGKGELRKELYILIRALGLSNVVKLIGQVPRSLMPKLMRACDIYVNTSLADGMPPSVLEAIASGKPAISFSVGGNKDIIDDSINGFLVPPKDYKELASKIIYLTENPDIIKKFGINARQKAEREFDINKRIDKILKIYSMII